MRILVLTHNFPRFTGDPAGAYVARLAHAAVERGHEVRVLAPHVAGTPSQEETGGARISRFRYAPDVLERVAYRGDLHRSALKSPLVGLMLPAFLLRFRSVARRLVTEFRPDVVHAHWWLPGGWIASGLGVPYVLTSHGSDVRLLDLAPLRPLARRIYRRAGAVTAVSRFLATDIEHAVPTLAGRVSVAPMPLDVSLFAGGPPVAKAAPPRVLYAGNLLPSKGVDVLLEAFARLRARGVPCTLEVLGEGPSSGQLRALAVRLGIARDVLWSSFVPQEQMPAKYAAATVTVLPTRGQAEGLGLTLVEALISGCAVVGTPAGGIPEVIRDEETGLLARDGDPDDLARQIGRLLADLPLRERLTQAGREQARARYAADAAAVRFIALYEQVAGQRRAA